MNIGRIPAKTARMQPQQPALIDIPNDRRISYGELDERVRRLANGLLESLGAEKGDRIAVLSKNCIEYMELYFACARVGLVLQPLNWRLGTAELARIIEDGEPRALAYAGDFDEVVDALGTQVTLPHWLRLLPWTRAASLEENV